MLHPPRSTCDRRELLALGASSLALVAGARPASARDASCDAEASLADDRLDAALERIDERTPDASLHRSNHCAMVVEALRELGRADAISAWLDENLDDFEPAPAERAPIGDDWRAALGAPSRFPDWRDAFRRELEERDWREALARWAPRLVPGLAGAATHGVIRAAHAARALERRDVAARRGALANGLAYWAATYEELPWDGALAPRPSVAEALAAVTPRRPAQEPPGGSFVEGLRSLSSTPSFAPVAGLVDVRDPGRALSEMAVAFARLYLANPERRVALAHSLTAPSALRLLLRYLPEEAAREGTRRAWQAAAGLYVVYGDPRRDAPQREGAPETRAERGALAARAAANSGAHAIKLTEVCLREEDVSPDPILLRAARDAAERMPG